MHKYEHRGTHGICDNKWKMFLSPQSDDFKNQILLNSEELEDEDAPMQYRRLSMDNFEKILPEFYQLKRDLGLIREDLEPTRSFFSSMVWDCMEYVRVGINYLLSRCTELPLESFEQNTDDIYITSIIGSGEEKA